MALPYLVIVTEYEHNREAKTYVDSSQRDHVDAKQRAEKLLRDDPRRCTCESQRSSTTVTAQAEIVFKERR